MTRDEAVKTAILDAIMEPPFGTDHHSKPYVEIFHRALRERGYKVSPLEADNVMLAAAGYGDGTDEGKDYIRMRYRAMLEAVR